MLTNPDKLKEGLAQLSTNPALKGLADMPGMKEVLDNPEAMAEQAEKAAQMFQALKDPEKAQEMAQEMMANLGNTEGGEGMLEAMKQAQELLAGVGGDFDPSALLGALGGGEEGGEDGLEGDALKARVKQQLADMMTRNRGSHETTLDEEF